MEAGSQIGYIFILSIQLWLIALAGLVSIVVDKIVPVPWAGKQSYECFPSASNRSQFSASQISNFFMAYDPWNMLVITHAFIFNWLIDRVTRGEGIHHV